MRFALFLLVIVSLVPTTRANPDLDKRYDEFAQVVRQEINSAEFQTVFLNKFQERESGLMLQQLTAELDRQPHTAQQVRTVASWVTRINPSLQIQRLADALLNDLTAEDNAKKARAKVELDALLTNVAKICGSAQKAADLDATIKDLAIYQRSADNNYTTVIDPQDFRRGSQMYEFVKTWQDYLSARNSGNADGARSAIYNLKNTVDPGLFARSQILALPLRDPQSDRAKTDVADITPETPARASVGSILARLETAKIDDLADIWKELSVYSSANERPRDLSDILERIQGIRSHKQALAEGLVSLSLFTSREEKRTALSNPYYSEKILDSFDRLDRELRRETLLVVFKDSGLKPADGETLDSFIQRVAETAAAAENWEYALRTLEFYRALFPATTAPAWVSRELGSCTTYSGARRLDEAGQLPQAILAYHDTLRTAGRLVPVEIITARLDEIRKTQPEAFAEAARLPRAVVYYQPPFEYGRRDQFNNSGAPNTYLMPKSENPLNPASRRSRPGTQ